MIKHVISITVVLAGLSACNVHVPAEPPNLPPQPTDAAPAPRDANVEIIDAGGLFDAGPSDSGRVSDSGSVVGQDSGNVGDTVVVWTDSGAGGQRCGNPFECPPNFFCSRRGLCEPNPDQDDAGQPPPHDDHGDSMDRATQMMPNQPMAGALQQGGDEDFFRVLIVEPGWYRIFTTGNTDTFCHLLDANAVQLAQNDDGGARWNCLISHQLQPGVYGVRLRHFNDLVGTGEYTLHIEGPGPEPAACGNGVVEPPEQCDDGNRQAGDGCDADCRNEEPPPEPDDHSNTGANATTIHVNERLDGHLETVGDVDYFVLTTDREMRVLVGTLGTTDTRCQAELVQGNVIDLDADSGPGSNCRLNFTVQAGRPVYLRIEGERQAVRGEYTLFAAQE